MKKKTLLALTTAAAAAWQLPRTLGLAEGQLAVFVPVLAPALFYLLKTAFSITDKRLNRCAYGLGALFAIVTVVCQDLKQNGGFSAFQWWNFLNGALAAAAFALAFGAALALAFQAAARAQDKQPGTESAFSRVLGNWAFVFALLLICWLPVWLAFFPGSFVADSATQFYQYYDDEFTAHHPLLHTLLLGWLMTMGIDMDPEGSGNGGVALYGIVQMVLMAAILAWACRWLRKRGAPLWSRVCATLLFALLPLYAFWSYSPQKDVLFGGVALLFVLEMTDLWRDGFAGLKSPWRIARVVLSAALMMLLRNNGLYALLLTVPFAIVWARGARVRMGVLLAACLALYFGVNAGIMAALEAEGTDRVEMLSIPLQQMARTLQKEPDALPDDDAALMDEVYPEGFAEYYYPPLADPVKWASDYDVVNERWGEILGVWARLLPGHFGTYTEAFLIQNLPYVLPGCDAIYNMDTEPVELELFPIQPDSRLPALQEAYLEYDRSLTLLGLPGVRLLSDSAFQVWLCMAGLTFAIYRGQKQWMVGFTFLLAIWFTCLLGPVALMRYVLALFYTVPVLLAAMLAPQGKPAQA